MDWVKGKSIVEYKLNQTDFSKGDTAKIEFIYPILSGIIPRSKLGILDKEDSIKYFDLEIDIEILTSKFQFLMSDDTVINFIVFNQWDFGSKTVTDTSFFKSLETTQSN